NRYFIRHHHVLDTILIIFGQKR
ncbi:unnamed protein product, partial [Allacma fusca]